jgi:hypothetical protein
MLRLSDKVKLMLINSSMSEIRKKQELLISSISVNGKRSMKLVVELKLPHSIVSTIMKN